MRSPDQGVGVRARTTQANAAATSDHPQKRRQPATSQSASDMRSATPSSTIQADIRKTTSERYAAASASKPTRTTIAGLDMMVV